jgi:hypothetical protein
MASIVESFKNSYCITVMRNQNCFIVAAFILSTSAKYKQKILSLCNATISFTNSVETKCGKEMEGQTSIKFASGQRKLICNT